jgi:hypothetical protein
LSAERIRRYEFDALPARAKVVFARWLSLRYQPRGELSVWLREARALGTESMCLYEAAKDVFSDHLDDYAQHLEMMDRLRRKYSR